MAKVRLLKKDIDFVTHLVVTECFQYLLDNDDKNKTEVYKIINNAVAFENSLIQRTNHPKGNVRNHYIEVKKDLAENAKNTLDELNKLK